MQPIDKMAMPHKVNTKVILPPKASGVPTSHNHDHAKYDHGKVIKAKANEPSIGKTAKINDVPYRARSGREIRIPSHYK